MTKPAIVASAAREWIPFLNPVYTAGFLLTLACVAWLYLRRPANVCKGRATRLLKRLVPIRWLWATRVSTAVWRTVIVGTVGITVFDLIFGTDSQFVREGFITWITWAGFALDDLLTGDDDRWHRFWVGARNRVRWLMKLPRTQTAERGTA